jgi:hypothetical protein
MAVALSIAFTATPLAAGSKLAIYATRQVSQGINFLPNGDYKLITVTAAAAASPVNVLAAYTAKFGALVAGQKILFRLVEISAAGIKGTPIEHAQIVT